MISFYDLPIELRIMIFDWKRKFHFRERQQQLLSLGAKRTDILGIEAIHPNFLPEWITDRYHTVCIFVKCKNGTQYCKSYIIATYQDTEWRYNWEN